MCLCAYACALSDLAQEESLKKSFVTVSENITNGNIRCGTTALAAYADNKNIYFANAGDCRAILWCSGMYALKESVCLNFK